jgi:hypothetical protein
MLFYIHGYKYDSSCYSKDAYFTVISHKSAKNPKFGLLGWVPSDGQQVQSQFEGFYFNGD